MTTTYDRRDRIGLFSFLAGLLTVIWRLPAMIRDIKKGLALQDDDRRSWGGVLEETTARFPDRPAIKAPEGTLTYREYNNQVNQVAHTLLARGLAKGDIVVVAMENRAELLVVFGAVAKIGGVAAMVNTNQRGDSLAHSLAITPGKAYVIGEEFAAAFEEVRSRLDLASDVELFFVPDAAQHITPDGYEDLIAAARDAPTENPASTGEVRVKDKLAFVFTSGTTGGKPKAAVITHRRAISGMVWIGRVVTNMKPSATVYMPLPFFHTNALNVGWPPALAAGASVALRRKFSVSEFLSDVRRFDATHFVYVGEMCRYLMSSEEKPDDAQTPLHTVVGNGLRPDIWKAFKKRFGVTKVFELYGAADGVGVFTNVFNRDCTIGVCPVPYALVKYDLENDEIVRDANGNMLRADVGEVGLLLMEIKPGTPFAGYTDKRATEAKTLHDVFEPGDAWFDTGDLLRHIGFKHAQFVDRLGDTFRWKGENVSTTEVEEAACTFEHVEHAMVYGVKTPAGDGRAGMMALVPKVPPDQFDCRGLVAHLRARLPDYAVPLFVRFREDFESTATHKVLKYKAREEGFDPNIVEDPIFVLLPNAEEYRPVSIELHEELLAGKHRL